MQRWGSAEFTSFELGTCMQWWSSVLNLVHMQMCMQWGELGTCMQWESTTLSNLVHAFSGIGIIACMHAVVVFDSL